MILVLVGFGSVFGQSWARDRYQRPRLEKRRINQRKLTRETDSKVPKTNGILYMVVGPAGNRRFWGLGGPGGPKNNSRRWGASPPTFWNVFWGPPGPPIPKQSTISGRPRSHVLQNPSVGSCHTGVCEINAHRNLMTF